MITLITTMWLTILTQFKPTIGQKILDGLLLMAISKTLCLTRKGWIALCRPFLANVFKWTWMAIG